jgi:hypothetical protein
VDTVWGSNDKTEITIEERALSPLGAALWASRSGPKDLEERPAKAGLEI